MRKALQVAVTACGVLSGCASAPVRAPIPPEPCPPGAVETMKELGIDVGDDEEIVLARGGARLLTVHEGWTSVILDDDWGELENATRLSGRLLIGDRVQGRFTQAQHQGRTVPVCLELLDHTGYQRGAAREEEAGSSAVKVRSYGYVRAVDRFE